MKSYNKLYEDKKLKVWLDISTYCNTACPQCHRTNAKTLNKVDWLPLLQWSFNEFKKAFPKKILNNFRHFQFCGTWGDPCMNKDMLEICEYIINNSQTYIIVNTNGSMRDIFWWTRLGYIIKDRGVVYFDIDGINQEMHSHYRQKTDLSLILEHIKAYSQYGKISLFTIIFKHNEDYLKDINEMVKQMGIEIEEHLYVPSDRAHHVEKFKFYKNGKENYLEHSPKYGLSSQRTIFKINDL